MLIALFREHQDRLGGADADVERGIVEQPHELVAMLGSAGVAGEIGRVGANRGIVGRQVRAQLLAAQGSPEQARALTKYARASGSSSAVSSFRQARSVLVRTDLAQNQAAVLRVSRSSWVREGRTTSARRVAARTSARLPSASACDRRLGHGGPEPFPSPIIPL
jgi:hypothetical protein